MDKNSSLLYPEFCRWCLAFVSLLAQSQVHSMDLASFEEPGMEATLLIQRYETDFDVDNSKIESRISRIGLILYEPSYPSFQPGLHAGAFNINQSDNPVTAGISLTGNYLGVLFNTHLYKQRNLGILLGGSYTYFDADRAGDDQEVSLQWHEYMANLQVRYAHGNLYYAIGGYTHLINGDEVAFGTITQTRELKVNERTGAHFELEHRVDATGKVGIHIDNGARQGVGLVFSRGF